MDHKKPMPQPFPERVPSPPPIPPAIIPPPIPISVVPESVEASVPQPEVPVVQPEAAAVTGETPPPPEFLKDIAHLLRLMGQVINNSALYGPQHRMTGKSNVETYEWLVALFEKRPRINLTMSEGELLVDGKPLGFKNPFTNVLSGKLSDLGISGFTLLKGMPKEEFSKLMGLLLMKKKDDMTNEEQEDLLASQNLEHVQAERIKYERVTEGEVVIDKDAVEGKEVSSGVVEQIMAFLKGDSAGMDQSNAQSLTELASDAERLAGLIMESVAVRQKTGIADGEDLSDIVIGCLRRTYDGLLQDPSAKTKKGKASIRKTMLMLEKTVIDKLHSIVGEPDPDADAAIAASIEDMTDDLKADALTTEYIKKRKSLDDAEKKLGRYLKAHVDDEGTQEELTEKFTEAGMSPDGWKELMVKAAEHSGSRGGGSDPVGMGVLAMLLSELDEMMSAAADSKSIAIKTSELGEKTAQVVETATQKVERLGEVIKEEEKAIESIEAGQREQVKMTRSAMMELLAEIVQELCQSLSAINCAVGMTVAGHIGDINEEQKQVLGVASNCGQRLDQLLDRLIEIVGLPKSLSPDKESVYGTANPP